MKKHKARPTEFIFDRPLDFRLVQDVSTPGDRITGEHDRPDKGRMGHKGKNSAKR